MTALILGTVLVPAGAQSQEDRPDLTAASQVMVSGLDGRLNIRDAADIGGLVVARVPAGTVFTLEGCEPGADRLWCRVTPLDAPAQPGWAAAEYLAPVTLRSRAEAGTFDRIGRLDCTAPGAVAAERCEYGAVCGLDGSAIAVFLSDEQSPIFLWDGTELSIGGADGATAIEAEIGPDSARTRIGDTTIDIPLGLIGGPAEGGTPCGPPRRSEMN